MLLEDGISKFSVDYLAFGYKFLYFRCLIGVGSRFIMC